jgi:hypothetical protein
MNVYHGYEAIAKDYWRHRVGFPLREFPFTAMIIWWLGFGIARMAIPRNEVGLIYTWRC